MNGRAWIAALLFVTAASVGLLWLAGLPLGVEGEWTWERIRYGVAELAPGVLVGSLAALVGAGVYVAVCWAIGRRMARARRAEAGLWLSLLASGGFGLLLLLQSAPPPGHDLSRVPLVLYDPAASGYFTIARYGDDGAPIDAGRFLAGYEDHIRKGDIHQRVLHIGTHPPGLVLFHRAIIGLCRESPAVTEIVRGLTPQSVDDTFNVLNTHARIGPVLTDSDRAALWLAALLTQLAAAATVWPLYLLLRRYWPRTESWRAVCLWPLVPALAIFLPKSDALYPFLGTLFLWLWLEGCARRSLVRSLGSGAVLWLGMTLSLALVPVGVLGAFLAVWEWRTGPAIGSRERGRGLLRMAAAAAAGFLVPTVTLWLAADVNLFNVWLWNYRNHAAFYDHYDRTWWKWLLVNPLEFALATGAPLALAGLAGLWWSASGSLVHLGPAAGCVIVWGAIWLWGKNMGEAARLWLVFQPWLVWLAAGAFAVRRENSAARTASGEARWLWTIAAQAIICLASVARVSGFHYLRDIPPDAPGEPARLVAGAERYEWRDRADGESAAGFNGRSDGRRAAGR